MKLLLYLLAGIFGLFGLLSVLRSLEVFFTGGQTSPMQPVVGVAGILLGFAFLKNARRF